MKIRLAKIQLAALLSGAAALIFELVWTRYLEILLGTSTYAVGTVTACYMVGLALGSFLLGRLADRRAGAAAGGVFTGFGVLCLLSPLSYALVRELSVLAGNSLPARAAVSFAGLLLPTCLIGGMIPAMMARHKGASEARVYAFHTAGSVLGAAVAGLWAIGALGLKGCMLLAALLAGSSALLVLLGAPVGEVPVREKNAPEKGYSQGMQRTAVVVYALSGFTAMAFQMYQTRMLTWFFMDSAYDFAIILAVFLTGSALGNFFFSAVARRETDHPAWLMSSQFLAGMLTICGLFLVDQMPYWTEHLQRASQLYDRYGDWAWLVTVLSKCGIAALFLLPVTFLWGGTFPLVSRICRGGDQAGPAAMLGRLLGWNTVGSACGSLMGSFLMVPLLGWRNSILFNAVLNLLAAALVWLRWQSGRRGQLALYAAAAIPALAVVLLPPWNQFEMSTSFLKPGQDVEGYVDYLYYEEDAYGVTTVVDFLPSGQKYMFTNRLYCQNTSVIGGPEDHRRLGYIPLLLKPDASRVLVAGLGAGMTLDGAASFGTAQVDCVEISQAVIQAAECFGEENHHVLERDNVMVIQDDARSYVAQCGERYDLIIADIFFPMSNGSGNLFSREYYRDCRKLLSEEGMMVQWYPLHQFSEETLAIAVNTFAEVFDYSYLWFGLIGSDTPVAGIVGANQPLSLSLDRLNDLYSQEEELSAAFGEIALDDPYMFLSHFITQVEFQPDAPVNTDDKPVLEYMTPKIKTGYAQSGLKNLKSMLEQKTSCLPYLNQSGVLDPALMEEYDIEIEKFISRFIS